MPRHTARRTQPAALDRAQAPARAARRRAAVVAFLGATLAWLLFGCLGLLWTIAFTADARSMTIGLAVWVFCFVVPSILGTLVAYRIDERATRERGWKRVASNRRAPIPVGD